MPTTLPPASTVPSVAIAGFDVVTDDDRPAVRAEHHIADRGDELAARIDGSWPSRVERTPFARDGEEAVAVEREVERFLGHAERALRHVDVGAGLLDAKPTSPAARPSARLEQDVAERGWVATVRL